MKMLSDINGDLRPQRSYQLLIDGEWLDGAQGKTLESHNPATGEKLTEIAVAEKEDVDRAVKAAWAAFDTWSQTSPQERAKYLLEIADRLEAELERFATLETLDNGKPIRETMNVDVPLAIDHFRYLTSFAGLILVLFWIIPYVYELFEDIRRLFAL